jgi:hypothetical protein
MVAFFFLNTDITFAMRLMRQIESLGEAFNTDFTVGRTDPVIGTT